MCILLYVLLVSLGRVCLLLASSVRHFIRLPLQSMALIVEHAKRTLATLLTLCHALTELHKVGFKRNGFSWTSVIWHWKGLIKSQQICLWVQPLICVFILPSAFLCVNWKIRRPWCSSEWIAVLKPYSPNKTVKGLTVYFFFFQMNKGKRGMSHFPSHYRYLIL